MLNKKISSYIYIFFGLSIFFSACKFDPVPVELTNFDLPSSICNTADPITLTANNNVEGTWSGNGISGNSFDPGEAGEGIHEIKFLPAPHEGEICYIESSQMMEVTSCSPATIEVYLSGIYHATACDNSNMITYLPSFTINNPDNETVTVSLDIDMGDGNVITLDPNNLSSITNNYLSGQASYTVSLSGSLSNGNENTHTIEVKMPDQNLQFDNGDWTLDYRANYGTMIEDITYRVDDGDLLLGATEFVGEWFGAPSSALPPQGLVFIIENNSTIVNSTLEVPDFVRIFEILPTVNGFAAVGLVKNTNGQERVGMATYEKDNLGVYTFSNSTIDNSVIDIENEITGITISKNGTFLIAGSQGNDLHLYEVSADLNQITEVLAFPMDFNIEARDIIRTNNTSYAVTGNTDDSGENESVFILRLDGDYNIIGVPELCCNGSNREFGETIIQNGSSLFIGGARGPDGVSSMADKFLFLEYDLNTANLISETEINRPASDIGEPDIFNARAKSYGLINNCSGTFIMAGHAYYSGLDTEPYIISFTDPNVPTVIETAVYTEDHDVIFEIINLPQDKIAYVIRSNTGANDVGGINALSEHTQGILVIQ